jgi:hypothetical protein
MVGLFCCVYRPLLQGETAFHRSYPQPCPKPYDDVTYVYDDVTYVYDDVTYVYDDVTYVYDDVTCDVS